MPHQRPRLKTGAAEPKGRRNRWRAEFFALPIVGSVRQVLEEEDDDEDEYDFDW
jgi:hypothetical protein